MTTGSHDERRRERSDIVRGERQERVTDDLPEEVRQARAQDDRHGQPGREPGQHRQADPSRRDARGHERGRDRDRDQDQDAVQQPPADRPEDPLPEEQRQADREEQPGEDRRADREPAERRDTLDLVGDLLELGLRELDVGLDEAAARGDRGRDLGAQSGRWRWRAAASSPGFDRSAAVVAGVASPTRPSPWTPARPTRMRRTPRPAPVARPPFRQAGRPAADRPDPGSAVRATATRPVGWAPRVCASGRPGDDTSGRRRDRHPLEGRRVLQRRRSRPDGQAAPRSARPPSWSAASKNP